MFYDLASTTWGDEELAAIQRVCQSDRYTMGEEVKRFEHDDGQVWLQTSHYVRHRLAVCDHDVEPTERRSLTRCDTGPSEHLQIVDYTDRP